MNTVADLASAYHFAAIKHVNQRRKGAAAEPYTNHLIEVADLVATATGGVDIDLICAAVLHDTIEDTETTKSELAAAFGQGVADLVMEVTDDKSLEKGERKRLQIEHAAHATTNAKMIKVSDKTSNLRSLAASQPAHWAPYRIAEYVAWAGRVVDGCRGVNPSLEKQFDEARETLRQMGIARVMPSPQERPDLYDHYDGTDDPDCGGIVISEETKDHLAKLKAERAAE